MSDPADDVQTRYSAFLAELTEITRKYGIAVQAVGGVYIADDPENFSGLNYVKDHTSGDLLPDWESLEATAGNTP